MKAFLISAVFFVAVVAVTLAVYPMLAVSASHAFSRDSARIDHPAPVDGRLGWYPGVDDN